MYLRQQEHGACSNQNFFIVGVDSRTMCERLPFFVSTAVNWRDGKTARPFSRLAVERHAPSKHYSLRGAGCYPYRMRHEITHPLDQI